MKTVNTTDVSPALSNANNLSSVAANENNLKSYFSKLIELQEQDEPFPVDLDLVWPIAYTRKNNCVRDLKENFIEEIDYQQLINFEQCSDKPRQKDEYRLSLSCMEYLIVRKVRPVFDVYRKMFKVATSQLQLNGESEVRYSDASFDKPGPMDKKTPLRNIRGYMLYIKDRTEQGEKFPVDVDDVWELAYSAKRRVTDKLLGINNYNTHYVDGEDYCFEPKGSIHAISCKGRGKYYLSIILFEQLIVEIAQHIQSIYKEVFERSVGRNLHTETGLSMLPPKETNEANLLKKKSALANAFQLLVTVQSKLDSIKDRDSLQRVMLVLSDYNMLLNRVHPNNE